MNIRDEIHDAWLFVKETILTPTVLGFLLLIVALTVTCSAMANGNHDKNSHHSEEPASQADSVSTADAFSESSATGGAGGHAEGGSANAAGGAANVGDITNSTEITNPDDIKVKNTPGVYTGAARGNAGVGFSVPGFGFSVNAPWGQEDSKKLQLAQFLWEMGSWGAARRVMCTTHRLEQAFAEMPPDIDCFQSLGGDTPPPK